MVKPGRSAWLKAHRIKQRAAGVCRECRRPTDGGMVRCADCKLKHADRQVAR